MGLAQQDVSGDPVALSNVSEQANGLTVSWADGLDSFFHFVWLRDCCYCEHCGDSYSSKRFIVPSDVPLDIRPSSLTIGDGGDLTVTWTPDGHQSRYPAAWLRQNRYDDEARAARRHHPILWDATINRAPPVVDFEAARNNDDDRLDFYRKLRDYGFVLVRGGPMEPGFVEEVAMMIGDLGVSAYDRIFDLSPKGKHNTMGNTFRTVPPHTDEAYRFAPPGINVLGCIRPADEGGDSILVDGFHLGESLRGDDPEAFALLARTPNVFHRIHDGQLDQRCHTRMFALDESQNIVGVRIHTRSSGPMDLPADLVEPFYAAYHKLSALMMAPENQARFALQAGDTLIFDNQRVLHARTSFSGADRHLQICNVSREEFHQRLRMLARSMGYADEADQVLAQGVVW